MTARLAVHGTRDFHTEKRPTWRENEVMQNLGWLITALGVVVAILAPLGELPAMDAVILGLPGLPFYVFGSVALMGLGFLVTYFGGLREEAERLDRLVDEVQSEAPRASDSEGGES